MYDPVGQEIPKHDLLILEFPMVSLSRITAAITELLMELFIKLFITSLVKIEVAKWLRAQIP